MADVISPSPVTQWQPDHLPAYLSNGVLGLRLGVRAFGTGTTIVNGLESADPVEHVASSGRAPYCLAGNIEIDGLSLATAPERCVLREQRYDFSTGELTTDFEAIGHEARVQASSTVLCSRTQPNLVLEELTVRVDRTCDLRLTAGVDTEQVPGRPLARQLELPPAPGTPAVDGALLWATWGDLARCGIAYLTHVTGTSDVTRQVGRQQTGPLRTTYSLQARPGTLYRLQRIVALVPDVQHQQPDLQAVRLARAGSRRGFEQLRADSRQQWAEIWRARPILAGAPSRWQALADAAFFYLHTSAHRSSPASTSLFGLSYWPNYHYYYGHVMWDIETFAVPPLLLTAPDAARSLLAFRRDRTAAAQANAALSGYTGLQFPWEASPRQGFEASPLDAGAPAVEHHVSMDVALAFARYVHATGDREFAQRYAWPVLSGVAEWLASRLEVTERGAEFRQVNGIAETDVAVDNNAFVNMAAVRALREAIDLGRSLGRDVPQVWDQLATQIVVPRDPARGVIMNHDGYRPDEDKGETPEALAGFFPLDYRVDPELERETTAYYLRLAHTYAGAPMLSATLGVHAARTGDRDAALDLFEKGYADFVVEPFTITAEFSPTVYPDQPLAGPFTANLSGFLCGLLYGLPGIRLHSGSPPAWCERPVVLPRGWDAIHCERLWARQNPVRLVAENGAERCRLSPS